MKSDIQIHLYGSLRNMGKKHDESVIQTGLKSEALLVDILKQLKIPFDLVQLVMVNHKAVHMDSTIYPGDRIALFPGEYPVFADWKDFRSVSKTNSPVIQYGAMNFPVRPVLEEIETIAGLGFDYLELTMDPPQAHYSILRKNKDRILKALDRCHLGIVCHLPTFVYTADLTESIRKASLSEVLNSLETASELGATKVVLHPSYIGGMGIFVMDTAIKYAFESLSAIVAKADQLKICLCLENMFPKYHMCVEPEDFIEIFKTFPTLRLTLDTGHANIDDSSGQRLFEFIKLFESRLNHIHISDNLGEKDDHLPIGAGNIDFRKITNALKSCGYNETVTCEIFTENRKDLERSKKKFSDMLKEG